MKNYVEGSQDLDKLKPLSEEDRRQIIEEMMFKAENEKLRLATHPKVMNINEAAPIITFAEENKYSEVLLLQVI